MKMCPKCNHVMKETFLFTSTVYDCSCTDVGIQELENEYKIVGLYEALTGTKYNKVSEQSEETYLTKAKAMQLLTTTDCIVEEVWDQGRTYRLSGPCGFYINSIWNDIGDKLDDLGTCLGWKLINKEKN